MSKNNNKLNIGLEYEIIVTDKNGKTLQKISRESKSFVFNFMKALRGLMCGHITTAAESLNDTSGIGRAYPNCTSYTQPVFSVNADAGADAYGILIGSSDTPVAYNNYNLASKIAHGTGSGQMVYGASTLEAVEFTSGVIRFRVTRVFTNNSGSTVTVKEIGIAFAHYDGALRYFLIVRDVLASPSSVPDGATLTVRYRFKVSFP